MKRIFLLMLLCTPLAIFAQQRKVGNLTIFSEDGDKFYLILNGEKQNDVPQTNMRVEDLPQPYYNARIIFVDSTIAPVSKNNLLIADVDGNMMDVTYKIKKDKTKKAKLNYYSSIPVKEDYIPPSGVHVYHFGKPSFVQVSDGTVLTTTTTTSSNTVNANVTVPGVSMNVTFNDPTMETTTTTTTTTTHSQGSSSPGRPSDSKCSWPMNSTDFASALKTVQGSSFDDSKLSTAKSIVSANCLSTDQVVKICNLFSFEDNKLAFAKYAYKRVTDPKNYFKVNNVFSFESSKEELNKFTGGGEED